MVAPQLLRRVVTESTRAQDRGRALLRRPPGLVFHAVIAAAAVAVLYAFSVPGISFFVALLAGWVLILSGVVWTLRGVLFWLARRRHRAVGSATWLLIAPLGGILVIALLWSETPLRVRWALSQNSFAKVVKEAPPGESRRDWRRLEADGRVGLYRVTEAHRVGEAIIFYEANGALFDDAGFAYLPQGPFPELDTGWFESPQFRHLSGPWYAWIASW